MGRKSRVPWSLLVPLLIAVIFIVFQNSGVMDLADEYLALLPSLILIVVCIYGVRSSRGVAQMLAWAMLGVGFAWMAGDLNVLGMWVPTMLLTHGLNLQYLQVLLVASTSIIGVALNTMD